MSRGLESMKGSLLLEQKAIANLPMLSELWVYFGQKYLKQEMKQLYLRRRLHENNMTSSSLHTLENLGTKSGGLYSLSSTHSSGTVMANGFGVFVFQGN